MDNIEDLFVSKTEAAKEDPNWDYQIRMQDGAEVTERGYLVVNSVFAAICRGDNGVIYWLRPLSEIKEIKNLGEVSAAPFN